MSGSRRSSVLRQPQVREREGEEARVLHHRVRVGRAPLLRASQRIEQRGEPFLRASRSASACRPASAPGAARADRTGDLRETTRPQLERRLLDAPLGIVAGAGHPPSQAASRAGPRSPGSAPREDGEVVGAKPQRRARGGAEHGRHVLHAHGEVERLDRRDRLAARRRRAAGAARRAAGGQSPTIGSRSAAAQAGDHHHEGEAVVERGGQRRARPPLADACDTQARASGRPSGVSSSVRASRCTSRSRASDRAVRLPRAPRHARSAHAASASSVDAARRSPIHPSNASRGAELLAAAVEPAVRSPAHEALHVLVREVLLEVAL